MVVVAVDLLAVVCPSWRRWLHSWDVLDLSVVALVALLVARGFACSTVGCSMDGVAGTRRKRTWGCTMRCCLGVAIAIVCCSVVVVMCCFVWHH